MPENGEVSNATILYSLAECNEVWVELLGN